MPRLPFIKFFPNDWLAEPTIRVCSVAARGLWMDMLSLMHLSPRRGYLLAATGSPISPEQLARLTGCSADEVTRLLAELKSSGVFSCTDDGLTYSRRMVRDEGKREKCREAGHRGGVNSARSRESARAGRAAGTTATLEGEPKGPPKGGAKGGPKLPEARGQNPEARDPPNPPPGGAAADAPTKAKAKKPNADAVPCPPGLDTPEFRAAWAAWVADRRDRRKPLTERAASLQLAALQPFGPAWACVRISEAIQRGWQGLVFDNDKPNRGGGANGPSGTAGPVGRTGRASASTGKYDHLTAPPGVAVFGPPPGPAAGGPAGDAA